MQVQWNSMIFNVDQNVVYENLKGFAAKRDPKDQLFNQIEPSVRLELRSTTANKPRASVQFVDFIQIS